MLPESSSPRAAPPVVVSENISGISNNTHDMMAQSTTPPPNLNQQVSNSTPINIPKTSTTEEFVPTTSTATLSTTATSYDQVSAHIIQNDTNQLSTSSSSSIRRYSVNKLPSYPGLGNRYKLVEKMGDGAFSVVYKALDVETGENVAVKVIQKQTLSASQVRNFNFRGNKTIRVNFF